MGKKAAQQPSEAIAIRELPDSDFIVSTGWGEKRRSPKEDLIRREIERGTDLKQIMKWYGCDARTIFALLGWSPSEHRDLYRDLTEYHRLGGLR